MRWSGISRVARSKWRGAEAAAASAARAEAEKRAAKAEAQARVVETEAKKANPSLIAKTKVMLTPGTQIEYATVESRIVGDFRGWEGRTLFTLENGQRWQAVGSDVYAGPPIPNPAVKIVPGMLGAYWMSIEGINRRRESDFGWRQIRGSRLPSPRRWRGLTASRGFVVAPEPWSSANSAQISSAMSKLSRHSDQRLKVKPLHLW